MKLFSCHLSGLARSCECPAIRPHPPSFPRSLLPPLPPFLTNKKLFSSLSRNSWSLPTFSSLLKALSNLLLLLALLLLLLLLVAVAVVSPPSLPPSRPAPLSAAAGPEEAEAAIVPCFPLKEERSR